MRIKMSFSPKAKRQKGGGKKGEKKQRGRGKRGEEGKGKKKV